VPGTLTAGTVPAPAIEARDLLDDLDLVLGTDRVRLADVPALLRDLAPT
jgi:S-DNA-T family DNA segregation ATPase FtsK/SpoIIIE